MKTTHLKQSWMRPTALLVAGSLMVPTLAGCGGGGGDNSGASAPPIDDTRGGTVVPNGRPMARATMSPGKKKMVMLAGAAALYYMYKKSQNAKAANGPQSKYYRSESNGRIYYRDAKGQAHYVTPPQQPIQVPEQEASEYQGYQGYNNAPKGNPYGGYGGGGSSNGRVPAPAY